MKYIQSEHVKVYRRMIRLHLLIGIPSFELSTPDNKDVIQGELIKFEEIPWKDRQEGWSNRRLRFLLKWERIIDGWEKKKWIRDHQLNTDEILANSEPTDEQSLKAHYDNIARLKKNGKPIHRPFIFWEDEAPQGTMFYAETCSMPRPEFWWLPKLNVSDRANIDHHIAGEIARGEWD